MLLVQLSQILHLMHLLLHLTVISVDLLKLLLQWQFFAFAHQKVEFHVLQPWCLDPEQRSFSVNDRDSLFEKPVFHRRSSNKRPLNNTF
ncbi:hypothetical protein H5410_029643 [Solanum commersonii]|uniref:Uncharacterized protein n=1 Tax=Solanum commersonii TaxID=4109 RepID=A0A9J5YDA8_SOLCO|nr:hypothetical protein H5410_029643 [Solanum commersonii]